MPLLTDLSTNVMPFGDTQACSLICCNSLRERGKLVTPSLCWMVEDVRGELEDIAEEAEDGSEEESKEA